MITSAAFLAGRICSVALDVRSTCASPAPSPFMTRLVSWATALLRSFNLFFWLLAHSKTKSCISLVACSRNSTNWVNLGYLELTSNCLTARCLYLPCRYCGNLLTILTIFARVSISSSRCIASGVSLHTLVSSANSCKPGPSPDLIAGPPTIFWTKHSDIWYSLPNLPFNNSLARLYPDAGSIMVQHSTTFRAFNPCNTKVICSI